jgi:uncharacterized protein (DUF697 family)
MVKKEKKVRKGFDWDKYAEPVLLAAAIVVVLLAIAAGVVLGAVLLAMWPIAVRIVAGIIEFFLVVGFGVAVITIFAFFVICKDPQIFYPEGYAEGNDDLPEI